MITYLFGAGASHGYSESSTMLSPPLAKNFFSTYGKLDIAADRFVRVGSIINYVRDTRGLNPIEFAYWEENIEDFLTEIDDQIENPKKVSALDFADKFSLDKSYTEMLFLFSSVLNEIQNGEICSNYAALCKTLADDDVLITFNWDTLLDRALDEFTGWSPDSGYNICIQKIFRDEWITPSKKFEISPKLLKLHGSTNWLMPYYSLDYRFDERRFANLHIGVDERPIYCFHLATKKYKTFGDRSRNGYQPYSYFYYPPDLPLRSDNDAGPGRVRMSFVAAPDVPEFRQVKTGGAPLASMPLLIPPVREKRYSMMGDTFDNLWDEAGIAIRNCEYLVIVGYSFPITDVKSWDLLSTALSERKQPLKIILVDPYPDALVSRLNERVSELINLTVIKDTFRNCVSGWHGKNLA